jgi:hypothetical protein
MEQELKVANELLKMFHADQIPYSVSDDIHRIYANLVNGDSKVPELNDQDPHISEILQKAIHRAENEHIDLPTVVEAELD